MAQKKYSLFHSFMQRVAASKPGAWFYARTLHHFDRLFLKLSGNRVTMTSLVAGLPVVMLTSKGAKSGLPRTVPLLCIQDESEPASFAIIATNWGQKPYPAWYFNLKANPEATCSIAGKANQYLAHEAQDEEYDRFWQYASNTYLGYPLYKQRIVGRRIPTYGDETHVASESPLHSARFGYTSRRVNASQMAIIAELSEEGRKIGVYS